MASISASAPLGGARTAKVERAGGGVGEGPPVDRVEGREVRDIREEEAGRLDHIRQAQTGRVEHGTQVAHGALGLGLEPAIDAGSRSSSGGRSGRSRNTRLPVSMPWL